MTADPYRLPRSVRPHRYDIELAPDLATASFSGRVRISVEVIEPTEHLVLNAAELSIKSCTVDGRVAGVALDDEHERLTVTPAAPLVAGATVLELEFTGTINDLLHGFYRSTYTDTDGTERVIATTQMQSTDCRRAFPCWDEPDFKAVFSVTLVVEADLLAISNAPEASRHVLPDGRVAVHFEDTMTMSTYLVAFVVGPLEATEWLDVDGTPIRIVHTPGKGHLTAFGLDAAAAALRFFVRFYGIPYPGRKIDLVALPDFAFGAMENLGCVTFRETLLLVDPAASTQPEQQRVADVIAHELAHMWFGDLVTMRWWNGIWLNEAFATFMQVDATDEYRPDWDRWTSFALDRSEAFEVDALASTRSVEFEVRSPADAEGMFDVLTYQKGAALLRMLQQYLGADQFRDGIRHYLTAHAYGNTETGDLWDAIEHVTGAPVRRLMDSWIWQPGFPLVSASATDGGVVLRQSRFGYTEEATDDPTRWMVPVHVREIGTAGDRDTVVLLTEDSITVPLDDSTAAVVVNAGGHGFFRVSYDETLRNRLTGHTLAALGTIDRYNLVADAWAGVVAGYLDAAGFLHLVRAFADETELPVWQALVAGLAGCDHLLEADTRDRLAGTVRALVGPAAHRLGWERREDESQLTSQLRALLVRTLAILGADPDAVAHCRTLFDRGEQDPAAVDPDLLAAATTVVAATGDAATYDRLLARVREAATPQETVRLLNALADFDDEQLVRRTCEFAFSAEVRTQNAPYLLARAIANRRFGAIAWRYVREHWQEAAARFPQNGIGRMVEPVKLLNRPEDGPDVRGFFAEHPIPQAAKMLEQALERQQVNIELRARQSAALAAALG